MIRRAGQDLQGESLLDAGLVASGVHDAQERTRLLGLIAEFEATLRRPPHSLQDAPPHLLGPKLLAALHQRFLRVYVSRQSNLPRTLNDGTFNCVSATLLFNGLAARFGLTTEVVDSRTHAYARARLGSRWVEVETTHAKGFDPFRSEADYQAFLKQRDLRVGYQRVRSGGRVELVMIPRSSQALRYLPNRALPGFIVSNNAVVAAEKGQLQEAWRRYELAKRLLPHDPKLRRNADVFLHNLALAHSEAKDWHKVLKLTLFTAHETRPGKLGENLRRMMVNAFDRLAHQAVQRGDVEELEQILAFGEEKAPASEILTHNYVIHIANLARNLADLGQEKGTQQALKLLARHIHRNKTFLGNHYALLVVDLQTRHLEDKAHEKAEAVLGKAIAFLRGVGQNHRERGLLHERLGHLSFLKREFESAAASFMRAATLGDSSSARSNVGAAWFNAALAALKEGDCDRALLLAEKAAPFREGETLRFFKERCDTP